MNTSPMITTSPYVSRRKFLNLSRLALVGGVLASTPQIWATLDSEPIDTTSIMPEASGIFKAAPLPYAYDALEPTIDAETMHLHHNKHYVTYTKNLNKALSQAPELKSKQLITELLSDIHSLPASVQKIIRNNGGGYYNHSLFWRWMTPNGGGTPKGLLEAAIKEKFGDFSTMQKKFNKEAASVFGSGWTWLIVADNSDLTITSTPNQDNPLMKGVVETPGQPILGLDVWEHSYYLKYKNDRTKYIAAWWNVVNWKTANTLFASTTSQ